MGRRKQRCRRAWQLRCEFSSPRPTRGPKRRRLWVHAVGNRRSWAILARNFSLENGEHAQKESGGGKKNIFAMRTVEFNQALSGGKGLKTPPLPPAPPNLAHTLPLRCCSRSTAKKGTFLMSVDTPKKYSLTAPFLGRTIPA